MKAWLILHLLAGDPILALVDAKTCLVAVESFRAGHDLEIEDENGNKPQIVDVECGEPCHGDACV